MQTHEDGSIPTYAAEVLRHFLGHPQHVEDLESVASWRLRSERALSLAAEAQSALLWLVAQGYLLRDLREGVGPVYRLNPERTAEAESFLERTETLEAEPPALGAFLSEGVEWVRATLRQYDDLNPSGAGDFRGLSRGQSYIQDALSPPSRETRRRAQEVRDDARERAGELLEALWQAGPEEPLVRLTRELGLTREELQVVLLCLAPELDLTFQIVFGVLNDDLGRRGPTLGLLGSILGDPIELRAALERSGSLVEWRLLEGGADFPSATETLRLDARVVGWLLGDAHSLISDARLHGAIRVEPWPGAGLVEPDSPEVRALAARLRDRAAGETWAVLEGEGPDASLWRAEVEALAGADQGAGGPQWLRIALDELATLESGAIDDTARRLTRAVLLCSERVVLDAGSLTSASAGTQVLARTVDALDRRDRPALVIARDLECVIDALPAERGVAMRRTRARRDALGATYLRAAVGAGIALDPAEAARLAEAYPLPLEDIERATGVAKLDHRAGEVTDPFRALSTAARRVAAPSLPRFARCIQPLYRLSDVVLPEDRHAQLAEMVEHVRQAPRVLHEWGFGDQLPYGRGVAAMFSGPSGTGKTMAAQAIARELETDAYVVDLSRVISKYIGESEKNLDVVFHDAERAGAVLLFDDAEVLFSKRGDVKEAHDRYANMEVAYLLQRMEAFTGVAILATNLRQNVDSAFLRRLRFVVEFPRPDAAARERIWNQCFVSRAPRAEDLGIPLLARKLDVTGGNIRQIVLRAAFLAAGDGGRIERRHLLAAARAELLKLGLRNAEQELSTIEAGLGASGSTTLETAAA